MYYYEVLVSSPSYHKDSPLTYAHASELKRGMIVVVELKKQKVLGMISGMSRKPRFATKILEPLKPEVRVPEALLGLVEWLKSYYPAPLGQIVSLCLPSALLTSTKVHAAVSQDTISSGTSLAWPKLTKEQDESIKKILSTPKGTSLLHGETGSGKTRVYLEITKHTLDTMRSTLILTPEIGLTSQLVQAFNAAFPGKIFLLHSNLTSRERRERWLAIAKSRKPVVVIGPRSALFAPIKSIGLIVMDEAHDSAYKQEQAPHYQAARVAGWLAGFHGSRFIIGSATPLVQDYYLAEAKGLAIIRMTSQASQTAAAERIVEVVDMRQKENIGRSPYISNRLLGAIRQNLDRKQQSLIFINRRGTARLVLCSSCGWQAACPRCDIALTYHADHHQFACHTCGFKQKALNSCPKCSSTDILFKAAGTKALTTVLEKEFPEAKVKRFDTDNKKAESLEQNYSALLSGETDILVGTQMIGKGLDLPRLGLVGIVSADMSLYFPDYMAEERTYQLLKQVIGRVGRGHIEGHAVIQTYNPDNKTLAHIIKNEWEDFYQEQLAQRRLFLFPPFCHLLKLTYSHRTPEKAKSTAEKLLVELNAHHFRVIFMGPSPSFYEKVGGRYRWQVIAKAKDRGELLRIIPLLPSGWTYDLDPVNLL